MTSNLVEEEKTGSHLIEKCVYLTSYKKSEWYVKMEYGSIINRYWACADPFVFLINRLP